MANVDKNEIDQFSSYANEWWNPQGSFRTLHQINPLRLEFIESRCKLAHKKVIDVGCGGGILSESLAMSEAIVTGIDLADASIEVAKAHAQKNHLSIDYQTISAEEMAVKHPSTFEVIVCMELLEHVPDPAALIQALSAMAAPGADLFFSTINRNPKAFALAVLAAEYVLRLIPRGTHHYEKFIKPSELDHYCRAAGLTTCELKGMHYNPLTKKAKLTDDVSVNYLMHCRKI